MRKFIFFLLLFVFSAIPWAQAKIQNISATGEYFSVVGADDIFAEERARAEAKRNAVEQTALHIQSESKLKNYKLTHDEICVFAVQILQITKEEISVETIDAKTKKFIVKIDVTADDSNLNLNKILKNKFEIEENTRLYQKLDKLYNEQKNLNQNLKKMYAQNKNPSELSKLKEQTQKNDNEFQIFNFMYRAVEFAQKENYLQATELTEKVLKYDLSNSPLSIDNIYLFLGGCYGHMEKYDKAIMYLKKAYEINPGNETARKTLAVEHYLKIKDCIEKKQHDNAIAEAKILLVINPDDKTAKNILAMSSLLSGIQNYRQGHLNKAAERLKSALSVAPADMDKKFFSSCYMTIGAIYGDLRNYSEALKYYTKLSELNPENEKLKRDVETLKALLEKEKGG